MEKATVMERPTQPLTPAAGSLATAASIAMYEQLVAEKEAELDRKDAEIASLIERLAQRELDLKQAHIMIGYLSEKVADLAASPPEEPAEAPTAPLRREVPTPWRRLGS